MHPRDIESAQLARCADIAQGRTRVALDQREANVFRLAAMVIQSRFPLESKQLMQASDSYFSDHPGEQLSPSDVVRQGWVLNLPRLRDMLTHQLLRA